ncbi:DotU family type IV/VI secretion system protein [Desulfopila sp. IMCC35008]|uniref:DotU family type IV/VI secretion system protein n=1 Tax=Desulfopila sp. IMCC35008 TaxID=2653858 RepID=UPI0013D532C0|nr:DotU family type IV/VI secretion system protein [Desulfopila sp. IMCC35008]
MVLIDCFVELIGYVSYFRQLPPGEQPGFERVQRDLAELIAQSQELCRVNRLSTTDFDLAQFAVFAWIDETMLGSGWPDRQRWQGEQLQRVHYQTVDAGVQFFDKLNELQPQQLQVREVYYICLALGFSGRYCNPGDEFLLGQLKSSNLKLLGVGSVDPDEYLSSRLFPDGYSDGETGGTTHQGGRFTALSVVGATVPLLLFGLLFYIYRFVLSNVGENLLKSIH